MYMTKAYQWQIFKIVKKWTPKLTMENMLLFFIRD